MPKKKDYEAAINNAKLKTRKRKQRKEKKKDVSSKVGDKIGKRSLKTFTLRLPESELDELKTMVTEVNQHSLYRKISTNEVIRILLKKSKNFNRKRLYKSIRGLF